MLNNTDLIQLLNKLLVKKNVIPVSTQCLLTMHGVKKYL